MAPIRLPLAIRDDDYYTATWKIDLEVYTAVVY